MQGARGYMGGGWGEEGRKSYIYRSTEKDSHQKTRSSLGGEKAGPRRDSFSTLTI